MKRYLVFAGSKYYPFGGWEDLQGDFDSLSEAVTQAEALGPTEKDEYRWAHVADTSQRKIVFESGSEEILEGAVATPPNLLTD